MSKHTNGKASDNVIYLKNGVAKRTADGYWINEFGYTLWLPKSIGNMRKRAAILKEGINKGRWKGETLKRAEDHLERTQAFLAQLMEEAGRTRKRQAKTASK